MLTIRQLHGGLRSWRRKGQSPGGTTTARWGEGCGLYIQAPLWVGRLLKAPRLVKKEEARKSNDWVQPQGLQWGSLRGQDQSGSGARVVGGRGIYGVPVRRTLKNQNQNPDFTARDTGPFSPERKAVSEVLGLRLIH